MARDCATMLPVGLCRRLRRLRPKQLRTRHALPGQVRPGQGDAGDRRPGPQAALELRIHGVHGTSPASMLGTSSVQQVAGDGLTGLYRAQDPQSLPLRRLRAGHAVEAYSWGALTSHAKGALGWLQRVLWMGLLPFALMNLAYWARLRVGEDTRLGRWGAAAIRWAALLLTMLFVLTVCLMSMDLVAWQCYRGGTKSCDVLPGLLDFMMRLSPSRRIAVAAAVPVAAIVMLWFLSYRSLVRYESMPFEAGHPVNPEADHVLRRAAFWQAVERTRRLQRLHLAAAAATVVAFVGVHADSRTDLWYAGWPWWVAVALLLGVAWRLAVPHRQDIEAAGGSVARRRPVDGTLAWAGPGLLCAHLVWLWADPTGSADWNVDTAWRGHNAWFIAVFVAVTVLNSAVFAAGRMSRWTAGLLVASFLAFAGALAAVGVWLGGQRVAPAVELDLPMWGLLGALGFVLVWFGLLLRWHRRQRTEHPAHAWHGGGAAMMVGAAAWTALLFTTAAVTATGEYLNGSSHTVADLSSSYGQVRAASPMAAYRGISGPPSITMRGDVVLADAVLVIERDREPVLHRGRVLAESATVADRSSRSAAPDEQRALPDTMLASGVLTLPSATVELVDSCLLAEPPERSSLACGPEAPGYVSGLVVTLAEIDAISDSDRSEPTRLTVQAPDRRVRLEVQNPPQAPLVVPQVLVWAPMAQVGWMIVVLLVAVGCLFRLRRRVLPALKEQVRNDPAVPADSRKGAMLRRFTAAYAHRAERLLELVGAVTVWAVLLLLVLSATGRPPWTVLDVAARRFGGGLSSWWWTLADLAHPVASLSLYAVLGLSLGLVMLGSYLRRSESARKAVGVLWDLTTFWPRAAHPLGPPCYAERVVPELTTRLRWALTQEPPALVVVSGHSQGSLIALATLIGLTDDELARVRLVTYGSQLRALYGRVFPGVVGPAVVGAVDTAGTPRFGEAFPDVCRPGTPGPGPAHPGSLRHRLGDGHWVNLFRRTDPLGWRVFSDADSPVDVLVPEVPPPTAGDPGPTVMRHSGYQHTAAYRRLVGGWLGEDVLPEHATHVADPRPVPPG